MALNESSVKNRKLWGLLKTAKNHDGSEDEPQASSAARTREDLLPRKIQPVLVAHRVSHHQSPDLRSPKKREDANVEETWCQFQLQKMSICASKRTVFAEKVGDGLVAQVRELRQAFSETNTRHQGVKAIDEWLEAAGRLRADRGTV